MDLQIALLLGQDGIVNGAIYALLALALVLVFAVTRVIFIPQGEFVAYGALTLAAFQTGKTPGTLWLLLGAGLLVAFIDIVIAVRAGALGRLKRIALWDLALPAVVAGLVLWLEPGKLPLMAQVALSLAIVVPLGPMIYRLAYQPLAEASVLVLLIVSVAVHLTLVGLGLLFFGAEGSRTTPFSEAQFNLGTLTVNGQTLWVLGASAVLIVALYAFFGRTLYGKALRATAINRVGARLMGPDEAEWLASGMELAWVRLRSGILATLPSPEEAAGYAYTEAERRLVRGFRELVVVGTPETVRRELQERADACDASELMIVCNLHSHAARLRSHELIAQALIG